MQFNFEKLSVLVIEDTVSMLKIVTCVLDTMGVQRCFTACNGEEGYDIYLRHKPDIIITDWDMAPMNGLEFIEKVRLDPQSHDKMIPIIMMTGFAAPPRIMEARDQGTTEFLVKPFSASDLANRIAHVVAKPRDYVISQEFIGPDRRRKREKGDSPSRRASDMIHTTTGNA